MIVIVGVDGSETSAQAAAVAAELARNAGGDLHVVSAHSKGHAKRVGGPGADQWFIDDGDGALNEVERVAARYRSTGLQVTSSAVPGKPSEVLVEEAERLGADVIVVGNVRMQGPGRVLGSIANTVAHTAPCDVYIVKTT